MQSIGQGWLVLELTGSGTALGLVTSLQFLPVLLFGPLGGVIADRFDRRRILYVTSAVAAALAITLGVLVATDLVEVWMVYLLAMGLGFVFAVDHPTRQTFVHELVGSENLTNAVSLNSVVVNVARVIGPGAAGLLILNVGIAPCFFINAATYGGAVAAMSLMNPDEMHREARGVGGRGQLMDGLRYVRRTPEVLVPLIMMAVVGTLAYEFQVVLPLLARFTFEGDAGTYGAMTVLMGAGAIVGGLVTAAMGKQPATALAWTAILFGAVHFASAWAPNLGTMLVAMVILGAVSIRFLAIGNATLQLATEPAMRGRVMSLWAVAFLGSTPIGGPIVGWIGENLGPRIAFGLGGAATLVCGVLAYPALKRVVLRGEEETAIPAVKGPR
jgi:MFS family permease